ncbi:MAG: hypothetical protein JXR96_07195, partial [Deltaproteobacteria bacterium]|nr:hypothetical protein [Deltaproteobacteria bacterium]
DDDCDGLTDCEDGDCSQDAACTCTPDEASEQTCGDGRDNDCDGAPDCRDDDCAQDPCGAHGRVCNQGTQACECPYGEDAETSCADGMDNDCDGATDCADPHCDGLACGSDGRVCIGAACTCPGASPESDCTDGLDNDCDGLIDCADTDCAYDPALCGLELVGGIPISKVVPDYGTWSGSCIYTGFQIYSFPNPGELFSINHHSRWFKAFIAGGCYFMAELMPGDCGGSCSADQWCTPDNICEDLPATAPAGTLTVTGLPVGTKTIVPDGNGEYSLTFAEACFDVSVSFTSATPVTLTAAGGVTPAFSMTVQGVDWIEPPLNCVEELPDEDQDLVFTWTPADDGSWVRLYLPTWHHAGMGSAVICEVPDAGGQLVVPAAMVNYYLAAPADINRTYSLARFQRAVVDVGNGHGVALEVKADRACDFFHD